VIYSFNLGDFEAGQFIATRHPDNRAVGGDWVIVAANDAAVLEAASLAAEEEWSAPETRLADDFTVEFEGPYFGSEVQS